MNLPNLLDGFSPGEADDSGSMLKSRITHPSNLSSQVYSLAINQNTFFRCAPILYPKKLVAMVDWDYTKTPRSKHVAFLRSLEDTAVDSPWRFGFSDLMYKATKVSGLEAQYKAIKSVWWFDDLSDIEKAALLTYDMFKSTCRNQGHTYLKYNDISTHFKFYNVPDEDGSLVKHKISAIEFLIEHEIVKREVKNAEERFHLMRFWKAEESICESVQEIMMSGDMHLDVDLQHERFSRLHSDRAQMAAARCILEKPVTLISGRGGTGKTETVSAVLKCVEEELRLQNKIMFPHLDDSIITNDGVNSDDSCMTKDDPEEIPNKKPDDDKDGKENGPILYCAPTGKAASVIKKRVGSKAYTIHQVISSYKMWKANGSDGTWKFSCVRIVAVDECSMVSIEVIQWLLRYLIEGAQVQKLVLLGDHLQLPSVEPGNFMEDFFNSLKTRGMTVTLLTNHRSEGSIIFDNATRISNQMMPNFDSSQGFSLIIPHSDKIEQLDPRVRPHAKHLHPKSISRPIDTTKSKGFGKEMDQDKRLLFWTLLKEYQKEYKLEDDEKSHVIAFLNKECAEINQFGCFIYNKHLTWDQRHNRVFKNFQIGDKVICTKNNDVPVIVPKKESENADDDDENIGLKYTSSTDGKFEEDPNIKLKMSSERLMNGNLYKIRAEVEGVVESSGDTKHELESSGGDDVVAASKGTNVQMRYWVLDDLAGDIVRVQSAPLIKLTKITHAWALSIHKFQGSEAETIVYCLSGSNYETWRHVYTAVTRGRKDVVIVGSYKDLEKAVKKRPIPRQTALGEKMKKLLTKVEKEKEAKMHEDEVSREEAEKVEESAPRQVQTKITSYSSPTKTKSPPTDVMTPNKLSKKLGDSLKMMSDDDLWLGELTEDFDDVKQSPSKRKGSSNDNSFSPSKISRSNATGAVVNKFLNNASHNSSSKRQASDSPFSFRTQCYTNSPSSYPRATSTQQPQPVSPLQFDDSFDDLDCSALEQEAIISSQRVETEKGRITKTSQELLTAAFGSDEDLDMDQEVAKHNQKVDVEEGRSKAVNCTQGLVNDVFGDDDDDSSFGLESDEELECLVR